MMLGNKPSTLPSMIERLLRRLKKIERQHDLALDACCHDAEGNAYLAYPYNREGRRAIRRKLGVTALSREDARRLATGAVVISGGAGANWYVRKGGSDNNGGSSNGTSPDRNGTDMAVTNGSTQVTSATAAFGAGDVGKGINIAGVIYRIATFTNSTTIQLDRNYAAATGSGKTWAIGGAVATIGKLLQTSGAVVQGGDNIYVGAGTYRESNISLALTSPGSTVLVQGDVDGSQTGDAGEVILTGYTTNDTTAPTGSNIIVGNSKNNITLSKLTIYGGTAAPISLGAVQGWTIQDCTLISITSGLILWTATVDVNAGMTISRCNLVSFRGGAGITVTAPTSASADYDVGMEIDNCRIFAGSCVTAGAATAANSFKPGGVLIRNCTMWNQGGGAGSNVAVFISGANWSTSKPWLVYDNILHGIAGISANQASTITEDYNWNMASTARNGNVTKGTHTIEGSTYAPMFEVGQAEMIGRRTRTFMEPAAGSPALGFGSDASVTLAVDLLNRPRPAGGASASKAVGALERGNTFVKDTSLGVSAWKIVGPGYQDIVIPVDATSTTITLFLRYDSTYAGTRPQIQILNGTECGVANQTITATTSALNAFEQESVTISPTSKGIVTVRIISNDTNGGGAVYARTLAVT